MLRPPGWLTADDRAVHDRIDAFTAPLAADRALVRVSESADHAKLWVGIAVVLGVSGRRPAALRGTASLLAASAVTNLVGKRVFGGPRPPGSSHPSRQVRDMPVSGSFPSGHSASAAAFTVGATLESPELGPALLPLGALVGYSRLHVGAHWLSDVAAGMVIGAVVALLGAVVVPVRRRS